MIAWYIIQVDLDLRLLRSAHERAGYRYQSSTIVERLSSHSILLSNRFRVDMNKEPIDTVDEPSTPHTPQAPIATPPTMSPMINALTEATVASVIGNIDENTQVAVRTRITRSRETRMNLSATFDGFVPAANPNAWRDRDLI